MRIRFAAAGMCHSDHHIRTGDSVGRLPMVSGHEGAGIVEAVGENVTRVRVGDHVACSFIPACGECRYCATGRQNLCDQGANMLTGELIGGGFRFHDDAGADLGGFCMLGTFSQRAVVSQASCVRIDRDVSFEVAALVGCGVPTGWGTSVYAAGVRPGDTVVIFGAGGVGVTRYRVPGTPVLGWSSSSIRCRSSGTPPCPSARRTRSPTPVPFRKRWSR